MPSFPQRGTMRVILGHRFCVLDTQRFSAHRQRKIWFVSMLEYQRIAKEIGCRKCSQQMGGRVPFSMFLGASFGSWRHAYVQL